MNIDDNVDWGVDRFFGAGVVIGDNFGVDGDIGDEVGWSDVQLV